MGLIAAIAIGAAYEAEEARRRAAVEEPIPVRGYWRAAQSCYPGVFAPRQLAQGLAEVAAIQQQRQIDEAALEAYRNPKRAAPRSQ